MKLITGKQIGFNILMLIWYLSKLTLLKKTRNRFPAKAVKNHEKFENILLCYLCCNNYVVFN